MSSVERVVKSLVVTACAVGEYLLWRHVLHFEEGLSIVIALAPAPGLWTLGP